MSTSNFHIVEINVAISDSVADDVRRKLAFENDGVSFLRELGDNNVAVVAAEAVLVSDMQEIECAMEC